MDGEVMWMGGVFIKDVGDLESGETRECRWEKATSEALVQGSQKNLWASTRHLLETTTRRQWHLKQSALSNGHFAPANRMHVLAAPVS